MHDFENEYALIEVRGSMHIHSYTLQVQEY